ncbi:hypothetical protein GGR92_005467, partial [Spirosoma lacussanchae]
GQKINKVVADLWINFTPYLDEDGRDYSQLPVCGGTTGGAVLYFGRHFEEVADVVLQPRSVFRVATNSPQNVVEGGAPAQLLFEQQYSDDSWKPYTGAFTAEFYGSGPSSSSTVTPGGLITVPANTIPQTITFEVKVVFPGGYVLIPKLTALNDANNAPPKVTGTIADWLVNTAGVASKVLPAGVVTDEGDTLSVTAEKVIDAVTGEPLPAGLTFDNALPGRFELSAEFGNAQFPIRVFYTDTAGQRVHVDFLLTVVRSVAVEILYPTFSDDFSDNGIGIGYVGVGAGSWSESSARLCQTSDATGLDQYAQIMTENGSINELGAYRVMAKLRPGQLNTDSRIGVGLQFSAEGVPGPCFMIRDATSVHFLYNGVGVGPAAAYAVTTNSWYWLKMEALGAGSTQTVRGKIWRENEAEPQAWTLEWTGIPKKVGYPALLGGGNFNGSGPSKVCFDEWHTWIYQPGLATVYRRFTSPNLSYYLEGYDLGDSSPYAVQWRHKVNSGNWNAWGPAGPPSWGLHVNAVMSPSGLGTIYSNFGPAGTVVQTELRLVEYATGTPVAGSTLSFSYTIPASNTDLVQVHP